MDEDVINQDFVHGRRVDGNTMCHITDDTSITTPSVGLNPDTIPKVHDSLAVRDSYTGVSTKYAL